MSEKNPDNRPDELNITSKVVSLEQRAAEIRRLLLADIEGIEQARTVFHELKSGEGFSLSDMQRNP